MFLADFEHTLASNNSSIWEVKKNRKLHSKIKKGNKLEYKFVHCECIIRREYYFFSLLGILIFVMVAGWVKAKGLFTPFEKPAHLQHSDFT